MGTTTIDFLLLTEEEMDFGFAISNYDIHIGTFGFIIKIDVTENLPYDIKWVQAENSSGIKTPVNNSPVSLESLLGYIDDANCPDLAWHYSSKELHIFFANYDGDQEFLRFGYGGYREPQYMTSADTADCRPSDIELAKMYVIEMVHRDNGIMVPYKIRQRIEELEQEIIDEI